ncbi:MAG: hypothetical protein ACYTEQ_20840 [Planctomycetota bacterium]|jgi:hypothetical protein
MSLSTETNLNSFACDGALTDFDFTFPLVGTDTSVVKVVVRDDTTGGETELAEESGEYSYSVSATNNDFSSGGTVQTTWNNGESYEPYAYASGKTIYIYRQPALKQETVLPNTGPFPAKVLEYRMDDIVMQLQRMQRQLDRCIRVPVTDSQAGANLKLAAAPSRANKKLGFDASGAVTLVT